MAAMKVLGCRYSMQLADAHEGADHKGGLVQCEKVRLRSSPTSSLAVDAFPRPTHFPLHHCTGITRDDQIATWSPTANGNARINPPLPSRGRQ